MPYIVTGVWNLNVSKGYITNFEADFTLLHTDGTSRHTVNLTNFQNSANRILELGHDGTGYTRGTLDVRIDGIDKWNNVGASIVIDRLTAIRLTLDSEITDNYFKGQPIYGVINSLVNENVIQ